MHKYLYDIPFLFSVFLLTTEIDLTHHKVAAFVVLVACYACSQSPHLPLSLSLCY